MLLWILAGLFVMASLVFLRLASSSLIERFGLSSRYCTLVLPCLYQVGSCSVALCGIAPLYFYGMLFRPLWVGTSARPCELYTRIITRLSKRCRCDDRDA